MLKSYKTAPDRVNAPPKTVSFDTAGDIMLMATEKRMAQPEEMPPGAAFGFVIRTKDTPGAVILLYKIGGRYETQVKTDSG